VHTADERRRPTDGTVGYTKGQVLGGRWKPLQHWYKGFIYADVMATCGKAKGPDGQVSDSAGTVCCECAIASPARGCCCARLCCAYRTSTRLSAGSLAVADVKNDSPYPFKGTVDVSAVTFATGKSTSVKKLTLDMPAGAGTTQWFDLPGSIDGTKEMLIAAVADSKGTVICDNPIAFANPKNMTLPSKHRRCLALLVHAAEHWMPAARTAVPVRPPRLLLAHCAGAPVLARAEAKVTFSVGAQEVAGAPVPVTVSSDSFALYVTLTTLAQGRFEDNAFVMLPGSKTLNFFPFEDFAMADLKSSLRVEHTATYM
jgi:beta-mannosidase